MIVVRVVIIVTVGAVLVPGVVVAVVGRLVVPDDAEMLLAGWLLAGIAGLMAAAGYRWARELRQIRAIQLALQLVMVSVVLGHMSQLDYYEVGILVLSLTIWGPSTGFVWPTRMALPHFFAVPLLSAAFHPFFLQPASLRVAVVAHIYLKAAAVVATASMRDRYQGAKEGFAAMQRLARAKEELESSVDRLTRAQDQLVEQGKMAVIGQLVAGVAHELNTPLGAIQASASNLEHVVERAGPELVEGIGALSETDRQRLQQLLSMAMEAGGPPQTSREERAARRELTKRLKEASVARPWHLAGQLVELGVSDLEPHLELLRSPPVATLLGVASDLVGIRRNTATIHTAADRAARTVSALKRFAHPGRADSLPTTMALAASLDTVLTLHENQLKRGVKVVRDYRDSGEITAQHAQLDQVWTNLVHNAIQAMEYRGTLTLRVMRSEGGIRVEVGDDGPGIPPEVQPRVFEPFFTTKPTGEGSGLGLSICCDIVKRNGGKLSFETEPGCTVFRVDLPAS